MEKELQQKLTEALTSTMQTLGDIKDLAVSELPTLLQQAITWYGVYYFILFISGIVLLIVVPIIGYRIAISFKQKRDNDGYRVPNLMFDKYGEITPNILPLGLIYVIGGFFWFVYLHVALNLTWLKIYIAPKLWLMEYIGTLIK